MKSLELIAVELLTAEGWTCQVVQHRIHKGKHTYRDLFGCIDIVAIKAGHKIAGIQVTDPHNFNARVNKCLQEPRMKTWLAANGSLEVWGVERKAEELKKIHIFHPHEWANSSKIKAINGGDDSAVVETEDEIRNH